MMIDRGLYFFLPFANPSLFLLTRNTCIAILRWGPVRSTFPRRCYTSFVLSFQVFSPIGEYFYKAGVDSCGGGVLVWLDGHEPERMVCMHGALGGFLLYLGYHFYNFTYPHAVYGCIWNWAWNMEMEKDGKGMKGERARSQVFLLAFWMANLI